MGVLDEAIREHLDLKRRQGVDEAEIKSIEDEAFGSAGDVEIEAAGVVPADPAAGDQLDKVFEAARKAEEADMAEAAALGKVESEPKPEAGKSEGAESEKGQGTIPVEEPKSAPEQQAAAEVQVEAEVEQETRIIEPADLPEADAGDALEMERRNLAGHPTENYDVDAAIAEEVELDQLSESRLSEELDRALDGPSLESDSPPPAEASPAAEAVPVPDEPELETEPEATEPEVEEAVVEEIEAEPEAEADVQLDEPPLDDASSTGEESDESSGEADEAGGAFFDQENPLEGTPDFLEDSPESESLWFEQKEPGDFDFGD